ncbi:conserved hypothetical protein [delta proteobacterium NaphS2]|nr:conserved hypothetical protein [delta proteobacterium NaphS2]
MITALCLERGLSKVHTEMAEKEDGFNHPPFVKGDYYLWSI